MENLMYNYSRSMPLGVTYKVCMYYYVREEYRQKREATLKL